MRELHVINNQQEGFTCQRRSDDQRISDGLTLVQNLQLQTETTILINDPQKERIFSNTPMKENGILTTL